MGNTEAWINGEGETGICKFDSEVIIIAALMRRIRQALKDFLSLDDEKEKIKGEILEMEKSLKSKLEYLKSGEWVPEEERESLLRRKSQELLLVCEHEKEIDHHIIKILDFIDRCLSDGNMK